MASETDRTDRQTDGDHSGRDEVTAPLNTSLPFERRLPLSRPERIGNQVNMLFNSSLNKATW